MTKHDTEIAQILTLLQTLECDLHSLSTRADVSRVEALLHPEFREIGYSGRSYQRSDMLALLRREAEDAAQGEPPQVQALDFSAQLLAPGLVLLSYRSAHLDGQGRLHRHSHRSSLWRLGPEGWQMQFHQGTPCAAWES